MLREVLVAASRSDRLRRLAADAPIARDVARRFVAGETREEALAVAGRLNAAGVRVTLDELGEEVHDAATARRHAEGALATLDAIGDQGLDATVSVKPTALGLDVSAELCEKLLGRICDRAGSVGTEVTIDMEGSEHTQATIDLVTSLRTAGHTNVGCAVQTYLHRTPDDVRHLTGLGASLRICKGAYAEPPSIAHQDGTAISAAFVRCADIVLRGDTYGRFATHDHRLIARIRNLARRHEVTRDGYEFQMLYGIREPLQRELVEQGHRVTIYVPFGQEWYPYLVRRLAERPANLAFFVRALAGRRVH